MSLHAFEIGTDKLERLHAEAAERGQARFAERAAWAAALRWLAARVDPA